MKNVLLNGFEILAGIGVIALVIVVGLAFSSRTVLLLTIASGLSLVVLLVALAILVLRIVMALDGVERSLGKIAMGVRAIDTQTHPLQPSIEGMNGSFVGIRDGLKQVHILLGSASRKL